MKLAKTTKSWLIGAALVLGSFGSQLFAATSDTIDIHVSISGNKSVVVTGTTFYNYGALAVNTSSVSATAITVQNDSTVFIETYTITGAHAISDTGGTNWTLAASTAANQYALGAQFSTARPADTNAAWTNDALTTGAQTCSGVNFGNGTDTEAGSNVSTGANRSLWFRMKTPSSVTDAGAHTVTVTVSVL